MVEVRNGQRAGFGWDPGLLTTPPGRFVGIPCCFPLAEDSALESPSLEPVVSSFFPSLLPPSASPLLPTLFFGEGCPLPPDLAEFGLPPSTKHKRGPRKTGCHPS